MTGVIFNNELKRLFVTSQAWVMLAIGQLLIAWLFFTELEVYGSIQAHLVATEQQFGVTALVVVPTLLNTLNLVMLLVPLLTMRMFAADRQAQRFDLLLASPASAAQILWGKLLAALVVFFLLWLMALLQVSALNLVTQLDMGKVWLVFLMGLLVITASVSAGMWLSAMVNHPVIAAILTYGLLILLRMIGESTHDPGFLDWLAMSSHLQAARLGLLSSSDLVYFVLLTALFWVFAWSRLLSFRARQYIWSARMAMMLLLVISVISWPLLQRYQYTHDFSQTRHNTLSASTAGLLQRLDNPLSFTVYVGNNPLLKQQIGQLLARFKRGKKDVLIQYVDPQQQPDVARTLGITRNGEILVRYDNQQQLVKKLDEMEIARTIQHLQQRDQGWILNLQGHGEPNLLDNGLYGLSQLSKNLQARGYLLRDYNLAVSKQIPTNTDLIIIASPKSSLLPIEQAALNAYLSGGGRLLWLTDPGSLHLSKFIDNMPVIQVLPGTVVDATAAKLKLTTPDNAVVSQYADHEVVSNLKRYTLFPQATALDIHLKAWQLIAQLKTGQQSWNETGSLKGEIDRDPMLFERLGPLSIVALLERQLKAERQRLVVSGDSDFMRNYMLGEGDNLQLSLNLFYWLTDSGKKVVARTHKPLDQIIQISDTGKVIYGLLFMIVLPVLLIVSGFGISWLRRRK